MLKKLKILSWILIIVLSWQIIVHASDVADAVGQVAKVVTGITLVIVGVATLPSGGAGLIAVGGDMLKDWVDEGEEEQEQQQQQPPPGGGPSPPTNPDDSPQQVPLEKLEIKLDIDKQENNWAVVSVKLKNSESEDYYSPPVGYSLWATHTSSKVSLIKGDASPTSNSVGGMSSSSIDNSRFVNVLSLPSVIIPDFPAIIDYGLESQAQLVQLDILNSSGNTVYSISESSPNPSKPIPFVWKGKKMDGSNVPAGAYSIKLKAIKNDGSSEYSQVSVMSVAEIVPSSKALTTGDGVQIDFNSNGIGYVTLINTSAEPATDVVWVKMKDSDGNEVSEVPVASKAISFSGDENAPSISQNSLNFSVEITDLIDEELVKIEFPRSDKSDSKIVRVTSFLGESDEITYEYDLTNDKAKIISDSKTRSYSISGANPHSRDVYFNILYTMDNLIKAVYNEKGINYDPQTNALTFSSDLSKKISAVTAGEIIEFTTSSGKYNYDVAQNTLTTVSGDDIASGTYSWDEKGIVNFVPDSTVAAAGVKAAGVGTVTGSELLTFSVRLPFSARNFQLRMDIARGDAPEEIYPMERPQDPTVENISWVNRDLGIVKIEGNADMLNSTVKVLINGNKEFNVTSISNSSWSFTNSSYPLKAGENKINVIATSRKGGEVESGDATVYIATGNEPDLILISPRDRQVFESISFPFEKKDFKLKGKTTPGATIFAFDNSIVADPSGDFEEDFHAKDLQEGANTILINVTGSGSISISKTITGAYKFVNGSKTNAYALKKGDFVFNKGVGLGGGVKGAFDWVPFDPDHTGIYMGDGKIREAVWNNIKESTLKTDGSWNGDSFHAATQFPILLENENQVRSQVVADIKDFLSQNPNTGYDIPLFNFFRLKLLGHYDGPNGGFYCSELAWWAWKKQKIDFGVKKLDVLYPPVSSFYESVNEDRHTNESAILPAYLCEKTMKVKEVVK